MCVDMYVFVCAMRHAADAADFFALLNLRGSHYIPLYIAHIRKYQNELHEKI